MELRICFSDQPEFLNWVISYSLLIEAIQDCIKAFSQVTPALLMLCLISTRFLCVEFHDQVIVVARRVAALGGLRLV